MIFSTIKICPFEQMPSPTLTPKVLFSLMLRIRIDHLLTMLTVSFWFSVVIDCVLNDVHKTTILLFASHCKGFCCSNWEHELMQGHSLSTK